MSSNVPNILWLNQVYMYMSIHEQNTRKKSQKLLCIFYFSIIFYPPPISMVHIEKIFSESVLAETFPKPTLVKLLSAKYRDVT